MNNLNFKLYVGGKGICVDRAGLEQIPTPSPVGRWCPISHMGLVQELETALVPHNMKIVNEVFKLDKAGQRMFGLCQVSNCKQDDDFSFVVGLRNSHDMKISAGLVVGMGVSVCSNLSFKGEIKIGRKHTTEILADLPCLMQGAITKLSEKWDVQTQVVTAYKNIDISITQGHDILIKCAKTGVFPRTQLLDNIEEFENPRHPEFKDRNLWSLFNGVTELLKPRETSTGGTLWVLPDRTEQLHSLCNEVAGIAN